MYTVIIWLFLSNYYDVKLAVLTVLMFFLKQYYWLTIGNAIKYIHDVSLDHTHALGQLKSCFDDF